MTFLEFVQRANAPTETRLVSMFFRRIEDGKTRATAEGRIRGSKIRNTAVFSTRIQPDTRANLEKAAKANKRNLSQEHEHRLRRTFIQDERDFNLYGSRSNAAIVSLLGGILRSRCTSWCLKTTDGWITDVHRDPEEWLRDPRLFDGVLTAMVHALMWFKPRGNRDEQFIFYSSTAERIINEIMSRIHHFR